MLYILANSTNRDQIRTCIQPTTMMTTSTTSPTSPLVSGIGSIARQFTKRGRSMLNFCVEFPASFNEDLLLETQVQQVD